MVVIKMRALFQIIPRMNTFVLSLISLDLTWQQSHLLAKISIHAIFELESIILKPFVTTQFQKKSQGRILLGIP